MPTLVSAGTGPDLECGTCGSKTRELRTCPTCGCLCCCVMPANFVIRYRDFKGNAQRRFTEKEECIACEAERDGRGKPYAEEGT